MILFSDNGCEDRVDLPSCIGSTLSELGVPDATLAEIEDKARGLMAYDKLAGLEREGRLLIFTKTELSKHSIYTSRVYSTLKTLCKEFSP